MSKPQHQVCEHLQPVLDRLTVEHELSIGKFVSGKGWGTAALLIGDIPFADVASWITHIDCVDVSHEHGMISCSDCWTNLAEFKRYKDNWG